MGDTLLVGEAFAPVVRERGWTRYHQVRDACIEGVGVGGEGRHVFPVDGAPRRFHFKARRFEGLYRTLRALPALIPFVRAGCAREFENLAILRALGVHAPRPAVCGVRRRFGLVREQFLGTEWMSGWCNLEQLCLNGDLEALLARREEAARSVEALALLVRRLHRAGWVHRDLYFRNVLVREGDLAPTEFALLDCRKGGYPLTRWGLERWRAYDLACLDKYAQAFLSRPMRLRFLLAYLGPGARSPHLRPRLRRLLWRVERHRRRLVARFFARRRGRQPWRRHWLERVRGAAGDASGGLRPDPPAATNVQRGGRDGGGGPVREGGIGGA
ncbi:MAG: hypothetical protein HY722_12510 [Planctomycetes bacterium]|nr:hypothetical protein [Planctomycetota bacterium]